MNKQEIITEYKNLLKVKKANIYSVDKRRIKDLHKFYKGEKEPKDILLNYFFNWLEENDNKIDAIILFGSYCKGIETNESFNRHKHLGKEKLLSFGPSDIDAIIIYNSELQLPNYLAEYKIINESFEIIGIQKLNLFRDLIIIPLEGIKTALLQHKPEYVAGYLYSYYKNGVILKTNRTIDKIFKELKKENSNYKRRAQRYFLSKIKWLEDFST